MELPHTGKWHMETWPGWLGKLLGTDSRAPGRRRKAWPHGGGGHPPRQATEGRARSPLHVGLAQGKSQVQPSSDACCSPAPHRPWLPVDPVDRACSLSPPPPPRVSEPTWPPEAVHPPSPDRCTCCRPGQARHMAYAFFFPAKQQRSASQPGAMSHSQGKDELSEAGQCEESMS